MTEAAADRSTPFAGRGRTLLELVILWVVAAASIGAFSATDAANAGLLGRIALPLRMFVLVLIATWVLRRNGETWREIAFSKPRRWWTVPLIAIGGYVIAYLLVAAMVTLLFPVFHLPPPSAGPLMRVRGNLGEYLYWMLPVTWGSAAFGEEMLFRGFFFTRLLKLMPAGRAGVLGALVLQTLLFGSVHLYLGLSGALVATLLGFVLGSIYLLGGRRLWPSIILHGLLDSTTITILFLGGLPRG
jgi:membrane protease YdiL (CAAX protease family)